MNLINRLIPDLLKRQFNLMFNTEYSKRTRLLNIPRYTPTTSILNGKTIHIVDSVSYLSGFEEIFVRKNYQFKASTNTPYIIDCGANIGLATIYFKSLYPKAKIIAFEPDNEICDILRANLNSFGFTDVIVRQQAVWSEHKTLLFKKEGGFSGRLIKPGDEEKIVKVEAIRLKDFLNERINFLKIDIEGAETQILIDCADKLNMVDNIFIEYHSHINEKQSLQRILDILTNNGFRYHLKEAYAAAQPFMSRPLMMGMEFQIDVFAFKD